MTVEDPQIEVQIAGDTIWLVGTPDGYVINATDPGLVEKFKKNLIVKPLVAVIPGNPHFKVKAGSETFLALTAAMVGVDSSQAVIINTPGEVEAVLTALNPAEHLGVE